MQTSAIIVAAGSGRRFGSETPKQFVPLAGKPVLFHTLQKFDACGLVHEVVLVVSDTWRNFARREVVERFRCRKVVQVVVGGDERQDSVRAGLQVLSADAEYVAVHDAVRPLVSVSKIEEVIQACRDCDGAILAVQPKDTVKRAQDRWVEETVPRARLWLAQTPQVFRVARLREAMAYAARHGLHATDDAALVEAIGGRVKIVPGDVRNLKITEPVDLSLAEVLLDLEHS